MGERMSVALVQEASSLEPADNRAFLDALDVRADLVVLPEAFARDFGPTTEELGPFAETDDGPFAQAVERLAARSGATVVAGMFEKSADPARPFNTLLVRGGAHASYRKIHLYDSFGYCESDRLSAGPWSPVVLDVAGFRVGVMTCYDLRFPELGRALARQGAEVIVVPAAWVPGRTEAEHATKLDHWRTLSRARAIENTVYVVAVGQAAPRYTGCSLVVGPMGDVLAEAGAEPALLTVELTQDDLAHARSANPSLANRRPDAH
jgi:predicted amidohydrolase